MICETCGRKHEGKYGSGRFCCQKCARGFSSKEKRKEINRKVSEKLGGRKANFSTETLLLLSSAGKRNKGRKMTDEQKSKLSISLCGRKLSQLTKDKISKANSGKTGGFRNFGGSGKKGTYQGYLYQSSWELAFIKFCISENIKFRRCSEHFEYIYDEKIHKYYPDFYLIEEKRYIEIKGFQSEKTNLKIQSVIDSGFEIEVIGKNEIKKYMRD